MPGTAAGNLISGNTGSGVTLEDSAANNIVIGNIIGLDLTGTVAVGNGSSGGGDGVTLNASSNTVGGTSAADRNIISANFLRGVNIGANDNLVAGNYIGTDITGTVAFGNGLSSGYAGVYVAGSGNTIGGTVSGAGNVIAASGSFGLRLDTTAATENLVAGNEIGTNAAGTAAFPNAFGGIFINLASMNTIGGTTLAAANLVSGNDNAGIGINGSDNLLEGNFVGTASGGTSALANGGNGVIIDAGGSGNTVGGTTAATANVVSGNTGYGFQFDGSTTTGNILANNWVGTGSGGVGNVPNGGGALEITNSAAVLAQGDFTGNVLNQGTLGFWNAPAVITITGNYTQSSAGTLDVDLGGTSPFAVRPAPGIRHRHARRHAQRRSDQRLLDQPARGIPGPYLRRRFRARSRLTCTRTASLSTRATARRACSSTRPRSSWSRTRPTPGRAACGRRSRPPTASRITRPGSSSTSPPVIPDTRAESGRSHRIRHFPNLSAQVVLDGTTQPGFTTAPIIVLSGAQRRLVGGWSDGRCRRKRQHGARICRQRFRPGRDRP